MGCDEVRDLLASYVGGECRGEDVGAVEVHVALCGPCARELDLYREARAALATLSDVPAPPGLGRAIWAGVKAEVFPRGAARPRPAWFDEILRYAALLMLGIGGGVLLHQLRDPADPGAAPALAERNYLLNVRTVAPEVRPLPLPRGTAAGDFYLPRVEDFPADGAKDF